MLNNFTQMKWCNKPAACELVEAAVLMEVSALDTKWTTSTLILENKTESAAMLNHVTATAEADEMSFVLQYVVINQNIGII